MARRRGNGIVDFFDGFNQSYKTVGQVLKDRELRKIADEQPIESQGYTEDQGAQLRAAAESGQYDIGIKTKDDGTFDSYTVTPKADPNQSGTVAMQGVTDFMGKRTAGSMSEGQVDRARMIAQAGVMSRFGDPLEGQKLRQQAAQSAQLEKQGVLTDLQIGKAKREEDAQVKLGEVNDAVASYMKSRVKMGEDGQPMPLTDDDFVMAGKQRVFELANRGLFDQASTAAQESMNYATKKIQAETVERQAAVRDAVARVAQGDIASAMAVFNKYVPDGNIVQNVIQNKDGSLTLERVSGVDGSKLPSVKVESMDKLIASIQTLADPNALTQYVERTFRNDIETRRLKLSENADRRAGAAVTEGQTDKKARAEAAVELFKERNPKATEAEIKAVRSGILDAVPTADKNAPSEVKLAKAMVDAGLVPDMSTGLERALSSKSKSPRDAYLDLMKPQNGMAPRETDVAPVMEAAFGPNWREAVGNNRSGAGGTGNAGKNAPTKVNSAEDLAKLPKGARYTAPDGTVRVKQ